MLKKVLGSFQSDQLAAEMAAVSVINTEKMPSCFRTSELATCSVAAATVALRQYAGATGNSLGDIEINQRLASLWFHTSLRPINWNLPPAWDDIAGNYRTNDGWIRLHTNAPHHKAAALAVLGSAPTRDAVAQAVSQWQAEALETAIVGAHGCAAQMRSIEAWRQHPQGLAVHTEPLVVWQHNTNATSGHAPHTADRPLAGVKVLDLTRVLAGPTATRFLAAFGADVLRIDSPEFDDSSNAPDMSLGKHCAQLDLRVDQDRARLGELVSRADVLIHGYRSDALSNLGFGPAWRNTLNPGLLDVALCAYGWSGPWAQRRGFDSLVQMSSGLAHAGMLWHSGDKPYPLPVQALDHATGYLAAAAVLHGLAIKATTGRVMSARLSLAKTADLLAEYPDKAPSSAFEPATDSDWDVAQTETAWGPAKRLTFPSTIVGCTPRWRIPAGHFGRSEARWGD